MHSMPDQGWGLPELLWWAQQGQQGRWASGNGSIQGGGKADIAKCSHWLCQLRSGDYENTSAYFHWDPWALPQASGNE